MHEQLEILLQLQDLKTQRRELAEGETERLLQEQEFNIDVGEALEQLDEKIAELEEELSPPIRSRYRRIAGTRERVVVPAIRGTCYGCFISIPTAVASDSSRNEEILTCDHCGRFLYVIGEP